MEATAAVRPENVPIENTPSAKAKEDLTSVNVTRERRAGSSTTPTSGRIKHSPSGSIGKTKENGSSTNVSTGGRKKDSLSSPGAQPGNHSKDGGNSSHSSGRTKDSVSSNASVQAGGRLKESVSSTSSVSSGGKKNPKNKTKPLYFWTSADVNKWLKKHGSQFHEIYGELLLQQEVTGRTLIRMNDIKLEKIGITKTEHRNELMQYILRLRLRHELVDLKNLDQKGIGFEMKLPEKSKFQSKESCKDKQHPK